MNLIMKRFFVLIASAFISLGALAQGQMQVLPNDPAVKIGKLDNGMTYYIRHNEIPAGRAEFYLATHVGAIQETPDQDGLAHFLEHMCFNGTKNFPDKGILDYLQSIGASFGGNVNASTGVERTQYMLTNIPLVNESVIDSCILIMHDYSHFVTNDPAEIDKERGVILEERRARRNASWRLHERSMPYYYGDSKYATCTIIGSQENLQTFRPESLHNFYKTWYRPDLQALMVVGDVDVDYVEAKIKEIFADIPAAENPKPKDVIMIPGNKEPVIGVLTDPEEGSYSATLLWKGDATPKELNNTVVGMLLENVKSIISLVFNERFTDVVADPQSPMLGASTGVGNLTETMEVLLGQVSLKEGQAIDGFKAFLTEIEKARRYGFTDDEVSRAKDILLTHYEDAAKQAATRTNADLIPGLMSNFMDNYAVMDPSEEYAVAQQLLAMITPEQINQILQQIITDENMVVVYTAPEKAGISHPSEQDFRDAISQVKASDIKPNEGAAVESSFLDPSQLKGSRVKKVSEGLYGSTVWTLANGLKVILYPTEYEKNLVRFNLVKNGGLSLADEDELPNFEDNFWAVFLSNCGVSRFSSSTVSKMLSGKSLVVNPFVTGMNHGIEGQSSPKDLETAFQIAYLEFVQPRFDRDEFDKSVNMLAPILPNLESQPDYQLQKAITETVYGNNPRKQIISSDLLAKVDIGRLENVYRRLFNDAGGASLIIVGDFVPQEIKPLVEKYFGSIPKGKKALGWGEVPVMVGENVSKDFKVDMQTPMTTVFNAFKSPVKFCYDRQVEMNALSYILDMRYVASLREDEGGTYGAQTAADVKITPTEDYMQLQYMFQTKPAMADRLRELAFKGLNDLAADGPTAEEFDMAKKNLQKNLPEDKVKNSWWLSAFVAYETMGNDRVANLEPAIERLTPEAVQNAAKAILDGTRVEIVMRPGVTAEVE